MYPLKAYVHFKMSGIPQSYSQSHHKMATQFLHKTCQLDIFLPRRLLGYIASVTPAATCIGKQVQNAPSKNDHSRQKQITH